MTLAGDPPGHIQGRKRDDRARLAVLEYEDRRQHRGSHHELVAAYPIYPLAAGMPGHFVYIVRCGDGTLYTGYARDPAARRDAHNNGRGAKYTAGRRPVTLVHTEAFDSLGDALRREHQIKCLTRLEKEALVGVKRRRRRR